MTDVPAFKVKSVAKKTTVNTPTKLDDNLLQDAKERIIRLQKKSKKNPAKANPTGSVKSFKSQKTTASRGVVYLGHLPHGFYEEELRGFFTQFGKVSRVKVSRSRKTGKSKGYAFVEFAFDDVAKIVAQTMNNYLMFERLVKAEYIPPEKVHASMFPKYWITPECYPALVRRNKLKKLQDAPISQEKKDEHRQKITSKINRSIKKLTAMGIDYFPQIYDPEMKKTAVPLTVETCKVSQEVEEDMSDEVPQLVAVPSSEPAVETPDASKKRRQSVKKTPVQNITAKSPSTTPKKRITRQAAAAAAAGSTPKASPSVGLKKTSKTIATGKKKSVMPDKQINDV